MNNKREKLLRVNLTAQILSIEAGISEMKKNSQKEKFDIKKVLSLYQGNKYRQEDDREVYSLMKQVYYLKLELTYYRNSDINSLKDLSEYMNRLEGIV